MIGKRMGGRLGIRCVLIGLLIANGLWVSLIAMEGVPFREALFWYIEFGLHVLVGIAGALWAGYFFGQRAGMAILTKKRNMYLAGITYGWCTLWVGTLSGSAVELITRFNLNHTLWQMSYWGLGSVQKWEVRRRAARRKTVGIIHENISCLE